MGCNTLTIGATRTSYSPLRSEFAACEPRRYAFKVIKLVENKYAS
jgi:hypothetical protein